jgi:hypothetical protein
MLRLLKVLVVMLPIIGLLLGTSSALALGVGVAPGKMEFKVRPGGSEVQTLYVINQSDQETEFQVYVEGKNENWFEITPSQFTLKAKETREVEIVVAPPLVTIPGDHDFSMCILCLASETDLRMGAGVKVPAHVQITSPIMAMEWWIAMAAFILALVLGIIVGRRQRVKYYDF